MSPAQDARRGSRRVAARLTRPTKYGRRPDGRPRDPWKRGEDAQALGYSSPAAFRAARGERLGYSRGQSVGHPEPGDEPVSQVTVGPVPFPIEGPDGPMLYTDPLTHADARRAGRVDALARQLRYGEIGPAEYRRRVARMRPIVGQKPLSDPE
jgi:hypothetical protein